LQPAVLVIP